VADCPHFVRCDDPAQEGGRLLAEALARVDGVRGSVRLAIPGGSALAALGPARHQLGGAWQRLRLTWVDERCVPLEHADSNRGAAYRAGLLDCSRPPAAELPLFLDGEEGPEAVARVEAGLDAVFDGALDVLLLGLGEDGHIASIFPGWSAPTGARVARVACSPKPPSERITLTPRVLARASTSLVIAAGESKREAIERMRNGDVSLPVSELSGVTVVTDLDLGGSV
jgi:6-phosphogluconolactonase